MKLFLKYPLALVNGLRRSLISHIPSFSLNSNFIENETDYNDDILRLRISMIPVKQNLKTRLEKRNNTQNKIIITSSDFEHGEKDIMQDIFLFELNPGQVINVECETEQGFGYQNSKWQVIQTPIMKLIEQVCFKKHNVEKIKTISPELLVNNKLNKEKCLLDRTAVQRLNESEKIIEFKNNGEYELSFISDFYDENYCLTQAFAYLKQLFENLPEHETIYDQNLNILKFQNQSFTFGNILQHYLQKECSFATFSKPHYLDNFIIVKFDKTINLNNIAKKILLDIQDMEQFCTS